MDTSGVQFNTIHANTFRYYEEINEVVQHEPALKGFDPEIVGAASAIANQEGKALRTGRTIEGYPDGRSRRG